MDKSAMVKEKIVQGQLAKWYSEVCLLDQPFAVDDTMSVRVRSGSLSIQAATLCANVAPSSLPSRRLLALA